MERVKLTITGLTNDVTVAGLSRKEIAAKYGISQGQIKKAMDRAGLKNIVLKWISLNLLMTLFLQQ